MERTTTRGSRQETFGPAAPLKARRTHIDTGSSRTAAHSVPRAAGTARTGAGGHTSPGVPAASRNGQGGSGVFQAMCPAQVLLGRIADKWTVLVLHKLEGGTRRYGELKREIGGVSQKMLTQTLRKLEEDGLVERKVYAVIPPRVEYSLTELARTLAGPLKGLCEWAMAHSDAVLRMGTSRGSRGRDAQTRGRDE